MPGVQVRLATLVKPRVPMGDALFFYKDVTLARVPVAGDRVSSTKGYDAEVVDHVELLSSPDLGFFGGRATVEVWITYNLLWFGSYEDSDETLMRKARANYAVRKWREHK